MQLSVVYSRQERSDWVTIERQAISFLSYWFLLWHLSKVRPPVMVSTLSHTFALWDWFPTNPALISAFSPLDHLFHNPAFPPGMEIRDFKCPYKGLYHIGHFYMRGGPFTLSYCINNLEKPNNERFRFLQILHLLSGLLPSSDLP